MRQPEARPVRPERFAPLSAAPRSCQGIESEHRVVACQRFKPSHARGAMERRARPQGAQVPDSPGVGLVAYAKRGRPFVAVRDGVRVGTVCPRGRATTDVSR